MRQRYEKKKGTDIAELIYRGKQNSTCKYVEARDMTTGQIWLGFTLGLKRLFCRSTL